MITLRLQIARLIITVVLVTVLLSSVSIAAGAALGITSRAQTIAGVEAQRFVNVLDARERAGEPIDAEALTPILLPGESIRLTFPDGRSLEVGDATSRFAVTGRSVGKDGISVEITEPITSLVAPWRIVLNLIVIGLLSAVIGILIGRRQSRRLSEPLGELAEAARRLGSGEARPMRKRYRVSELDELAEGLDSSAERIKGLLDVERRFVSDAAHQLRTPLTAVSLRLDEIAETNDPAEVQREALAAQDQVDRLSRVIDDLLAAAKGAPMDRQPVVLATVLNEQLKDWTPIFETAGRTLSVVAATEVEALGSSGSIGQVIATLVENALIHGEGRVRVSVRDADGRIVVDVADEGTRIAGEVSGRVFDRAFSGGAGSGIGLAVARNLSEHMGGRLELVSTSPVTFSLFLDAAAPSERHGGTQAQGAGTVPAEGTVAATDDASPLTGNTHRR